MAYKQKSSYPLRMADELKEQVKTRACVNGRSINSEINVLLEMAIGIEPKAKSKK
jgi:hypothetical protein